MFENRLVLTIINTEPEYSRTDCSTAFVGDENKRRRPSDNAVVVIMTSYTTGHEYRRE